MTRCQDPVCRGIEAERDELRAQRDAAVEALEAIERGDAERGYNPLACKTPEEIARAALLRAKGEKP